MGCGDLDVGVVYLWFYVEHVRLVVYRCYDVVGCIEAMLLVVNMCFGVMMFMIIR